MAITRIPEPYRRGLAKIKLLSSENVDVLVAALSTCPLRAGLKGMVAAITDRIQGLEPDDVEDMLKSLYSLYVYRGDSDTPVADFVAELVAAMRLGGADLVLSEETKPSFQQKIAKLLSIDAVGLISKAEQLRSDYERTFHDAKVITDIRPMFTAADKKPIGAAIAHTLEIEYHSQGQHRQFYVTLDGNDVEKLSRVLQRASNKGLSLQLLIDSAGLTDLSAEKS